MGPQGGRPDGEPSPRASLRVGAAPVNRLRSARFGSRSAACTLLPLPPFPLASGVTHCWSRHWLSSFKSLQNTLGAAVSRDTVLGPAACLSSLPASWKLSPPHPSVATKILLKFGS